MYRSKMLNNICECVEESEERFMSDWDHITTLQTLHFLIEKFGLDDFMKCYEFTEEEYKKYFKSITKSYCIHLHRDIKKEFEEKGGM